MSQSLTKDIFVHTCSRAVSDKVVLNIEIAGSDINRAERSIHCCSRYRDVASCTFVRDEGSLRWQSISFD